jgi:hypothetical protein
VGSSPTGGTLRRRSELHRSELVVLDRPKTPPRSLERPTLASGHPGSINATEAASALFPTSTFSEAAELYLAKIAHKRENTTLVEYRARLDN